MKQSIIAQIPIDIGIISSYILLSTIMYPIHNEQLYYSMYIFYHILVLTVYTFFYIYSPAFKEHFLYSIPLTKKTLCISILATMPLILLSLILAYFFPVQNTVTLPKSPVLSTLLLIIVASKEELFFRNYILKVGQRLGIPLPISITSSSLLFALGHMYQGYIVGIFSFFAGVFFCYLFLRYKSIYVCMICHGLYNVLLYILYYINQ